MTNEADKPKTNEELQKENQKLAELLLEKNELLQEAQETLEAIRSGAVDGIVRSTPQGEQVYILKGSDQPYRNLIEEMNEGAVLISESGNILYSNSGFAGLVDAPLDKIMGTLVSDWVSPRNVEVLKDTIAGNRENGRRVFEIAFQNSKQQLIPTQVSITKIALNSINASALIITDLSKHMEEGIKHYTAKLEEEITQRKKAQEALKERTLQLEQTQKKLEEYGNQMEQLAGARLEQLKASERMAAIGQFAGMVGHDIRNPLQSISGDLYFIKKDLMKLPATKEKEDLNENLHSIESSLNYINKIMQDLQDFVRPIKLSIQETNLENLTHEIVKNVGIPETIVTSIQLSNEAKCIQTDPVVLRRILTNLTTNALQAMPTGGEFTLKISKDNSKIVIAIKDTGVGIPKESRDKIFTPMFTTKAKGQGFGLAVVKRLTEALGGTVNFESAVGKGTEFIIKLPITQ